MTQTIEIKHGAFSRYRNGCRCDECTAVNTARNNVDGLHLGTDRLITLCWCERDSVLITREDLNLGLGVECGRGGCGPR